MGFYPAAPGQRIAYDLDGSQVFVYRPGGSNLARQSTSIVKRLNNEWETGNVIINEGIDTDMTVEWLFPKPYDMYGVWASGEKGGTPDFISGIFENIETSNDVHAVLQGTWAGTGTVGWGPTRRYADWWRRSGGLQTFSATAAWGARGVMSDPSLTDNTKLRNVHWYGSLNDSFTPDRILALDKDTGLELASVHDWGDNARGAVESKTIQIKNNSASFQADSVTLGFNSLNSTTVSDWHEMRDGGGAWSTSLSLGNIAADTTYANDIDLRITPSTGELGPFSNRLTIGLTGWT